MGGTAVTHERRNAKGALTDSERGVGDVPASNVQGRRNKQNRPGGVGDYRGG